MTLLRAFLLVPALSLSHGLAVSALRAAGEKSPPSIQSAALISPAGPGAVGASVVRAPDGRLWLSWIEPAAGGAHALRFSVLDSAAQQWSAARTIAAGADWFINRADFPALAVGAAGHATAVWFVNNPAPAGAAASHDHHGPGYRALISRTADAGETWSTPAPLTRESDSVEFVSVATLADGRVLAAWLDGRAKKSGGKAQQLFARILGDSGPDLRVDSSVCDCCQTTLTAFPDGSALLAYRGRTENEVRDIRTARFDGRKWAEPRPLNNDDWRINGCPVNGPRLDNDRGRVAAAWFTAADNDPRVLVSYSPDAGARFLMPLRLDRGQPVGRIDTVILRDGAILVSWVEQDGSLWLRRVSPDFATDEAIKLAHAQDGRVTGFPRLALVRDYVGGRANAQLVVTFIRDDKLATLHTLLVTVPEGDLVALTKDCDCAPTVEQLLGLPTRGAILTVTAASGKLRARHDEVPGVLAAGTHEFHAAPDVLAAVQPGRQFFGRLERRDGTWWLYDVRLLSTPAP